MTKDAIEAAKWWRKAAEQQNALAQHKLAQCYYKGAGVAKDTVEAVNWWKKSAENGNMNAQVWLGFCLFNGEGVAKDDAEAAKWYRKAAQQGSVAAMINLGMLYRDGAGVVKDEVEAYAYLNIAGIYEESARTMRERLEKLMPPEARMRGQQRTKELQAEIDSRKSNK